MKNLFLFLLLPLASAAQRNYPLLLDSFMQAEVSVNRFNGNVLVAKAGKILYQKAFGYENFEAKEPLDNNSVFSLASVSKQFTAMGILILEERRKLKLSDSLRHFFPELPYHNVTIQHLLTHTSGLPDYMEAMANNWDHKKIASNKDVINLLATQKIPVNFRPGEKWEYSNTAYLLLASIIEKVSGLSYGAYMQENIFGPLGMTHSREYNTRRSLKETIPNYAYEYVYSDSLKKYVPPDGLPDLDFVIYLDGIQGDGTISSTTSDLFKWDRAIKNHSLLSGATQKKMLAPQSVMDTASKRHYGYGVMLGRNEIGDYAMHGGGWPGTHTMLLRYIKDDITIIVLSNNESNSTMLAGALAYIVTNRDVVVPYEHRVRPIDTTWLDKYAGKYLIPNVPNATKMELTKRDGKLYRRFEKATAEVELKPESNTRFFIDSPGADWQLEFELNPSGNVAKTFVIVNGMKKKIDKIK